MPFRPLTDEERDKVETTIKKVEKDIIARKVYLSELQNKLAEGIWYKEYSNAE